jgi:hypothetical protein
VKKRKNYSRATKLYFKPEIKLCPHCSTPLKRSHTAWRKNIFTLKQTLHITSYAYKCKNPDCPNPKEIYRSTKAEKIALKYYQFGLDVIVKIGHQHFTNHKPLDEIKQTIGKLQISRAEIHLLTQAYLALTQAHKQQNPTYLNKIKANGGIILAIDGVQPEKGNQTLWILRDLTTNTTLLAKNLKIADADSIAELLEEIKTLNIPIKGIISDGQRAIRIATAQQFPNIPHQLCHFHFLRNIAKPICEMDRALKVDLKKKLRGIKPIEQKANQTLNKQTQLILQYCQTIRFALQDDGRYPLKPPGLKLYERLQTIAQSLTHNSQIHAHALVKKLLDKFSVIEELAPKYRRIKRLYALIFRVNRILKQKKKNALQIELDMLGCFDRVARVHPRNPQDRVAIENILRFMVSHWGGLFYHYDWPVIPRTNNALESFICKLKVSCRKITGRVSTQSYVLRYGAFVALFEEGLSQSEVLVRFGFVEYSVFALCYNRIRGFSVGGSLRRCLAKNFKGYIHGLEAEWTKTVV